MTFKSKIMDENDVRRAIIRMGHEILERNKGTSKLVLVGIQRRGVPLAQRIADIIYTVDSKRVVVGLLDINLYRDDLSTIAEHPVVSGTDIPTNITGMNVVLVDDVLYSGRTVRAAMTALMDMGRPASIQLAVLVDRGHRELPIGADYIGKNVPSSRSEVVCVSIQPIDSSDGVDMFQL